LFVRCVQDFRKLNPEPSSYNVVCHHGHNLMGVGCQPTVACGCLLPHCRRVLFCLFSLPGSFWTPLGVPPPCPPPAPPEPPRPAPPPRSPNKPLGWVERSINRLCKSNVIRNFVDQGRWPLKLFPLAELCFQKNCVEKRASIAQYCPCDAMANICCERFLNYMNFLQVQRLTYLE
jgi:hypothetical protein